MKRLTIETLEQLRNDLQAKKSSIEGKARATVTVHMGTCGISAGARRVMSALLDALEERGITDVRVAASACAGLCSREPMATVQLPNVAPVKYVDLDEEKIVRVLEEHVLGGVIVTECALAMGSERVG
jgi:NADP-reducing hydrogenase subunit HndB